MVVTSVLVSDPVDLRQGGVEYVISLLQFGIIGAVMFGAPLGALGGIIALWHLRSGAVLPRSRWSGRGSVTGVALGALGAAVWPLLVGQFLLAGLYALLGSIAGAIAGALTGALLARIVGPEITQVAKAPEAS